MKFAKQEFTDRVNRLEKLLEQDFGAIAVAFKKGNSQHHMHHRQKLVEQLQYHDIIRQKIQHVGQFAEVLELEFAQHKAGTTNAGVLPGLLELSMALLQFARLEYDEIRDEIRVQLLALHLEKYPLQEAYELFQQEIQNLIKYLGRLYLLIETPDDTLNVELSAEKLRKICHSFSMQTEREIFRSLFDREALPADLQEQESEPDSNIELF